MLKKLNNKKGFTLMEMLIVVAIIAVLVAIAIPVFNGALTKSKEAADVANVRAAYADWQVAIITGEKKVSDITADNFLAGTGTATVKLNYPSQLTINTTDKTVTYEAKKLVNENTTDDSKTTTFVWSFGETDIYTTPDSGNSGN